MLRHKNIDRICAAVLVCTMLLAALVTALAAAGGIEGRTRESYGDLLFDQSTVHTIDIVMDDWEGFLETCTSEQYTLCSVVIDGEKLSNVAIRGKGNTSLSTVAQSGSSRYSFKIEFDHYQAGKSYHGLDKLCLNNLIQDATFMKDYLAYTLMNRMGVPAPLCSYAKVNVNGEYWGLYLAVEAMEDAFLGRAFGSESGDLYKPDSMDMGGGKGNGGGFRMSEFREKFNAATSDDGRQPAEMPNFAEGGFQPPEGFPEPGELPEGFTPGEMPGGGMGGGPGGGMGASDTKLQYIDDDPSSYSNIFESAKTDVTDADQSRLIAALKALGDGTDIESCVDVDEVMRYFIVHTFLVNGDSYTGSMMHNYYLYEDDGVLSMLPWDYNLAFGAFSMGQDSSSTSAVNDPIDTPVSGDMSDRPMIAWIFANDAYTQRYHELYSEFIADIYDSGWLLDEIDRVSALIAPYVESDPTAFYDYEAFQTGVEALRTFCELRCQSVKGQLSGDIPATTEGQAADDSNLIDASALTLSDMGGMNMNGGGSGQSSGGPGSFQPPTAPNDAQQPDEAPTADTAESDEVMSAEATVREENGPRFDREGQMPMEDMQGQQSSDGKVDLKTVLIALSSAFLLAIGLVFAARSRTYR